MFEMRESGVVEKTFKQIKRERVREGYVGIDFRFRILDFLQFKEFR